MSDEEDCRFFPSHCYPPREEGESTDDYMFRCHIFEQCWARLPGDKPIPLEFRPIAILNGAKPSWTPDSSPPGSPTSSKSAACKGNSKQENEKVVEDAEKDYWKNAAKISEQMYAPRKEIQKQSNQSVRKHFIFTH